MGVESKKTDENNLRYELNLKTTTEVLVYGIL